MMLLQVLWDEILVHRKVRAIFVGLCRLSAVHVWRKKGQYLVFSKRVVL